MSWHDFEQKMEAAKLLRGSAQYLDDRGWTQHAFINASGAVCASRAISDVSRTLNCKADVEYRACIELEDHLGIAIMSYNDWDDTTKEDVQRAFYAVATKLDGRNPRKKKAKLNRRNSNA